jgi:hypothetical protein
MGPSDWIALGALAVAAVGPTLATVRVSGRRDGKIDEVLAELKEITRDHETRLRKGRL